MLWVASLVAALPIPLLYILTPPRENEPGGHDIASFELAGSVERANEILSRCLCFPEGVGIGERNQQV
jgi:hypothetical protein